MSPHEKVIETEIRIQLSKAACQVWKHRMELCPTCGSRPAKGNGLGVGAPDLICVVPPYGRFLGIECKRPETRKRLSIEQHQWMDVVRRYQGVAGVAASVEEAFQLLDRARKLP